MRLSHILVVMSLIGMPEQAQSGETCAAACESLKVRLAGTDCLTVLRDVSQFLTQHQALVNQLSQAMSRDRARVADFAAGLKLASDRMQDCVVKHGKEKAGLVPAFVQVSTLEMDISRWTAQSAVPTSGQRVASETRTKAVDLLSGAIRQW